MKMRVKAGAWVVGQDVVKDRETIDLIELPR